MLPRPPCPVFEVEQTSPSKSGPRTHIREITSNESSKTFKIIGAVSAKISSLKLFTWTLDGRLKRLELGMLGYSGGGSRVVER